MFEKNILILNSKITTFKFENGEGTYNVVTFAFRSEDADSELIGLSDVSRCSLNPNSFDITKAIKPNEYVKATLGYKRTRDNLYKLTITKINNIEV